MAIADKLTKANNGVWASPATITGSKNIADTSVGISVATGWPVDAVDGPVHIKLFKVDTDNKLIEGTASDHKATLAGTTLSNITKTGGPDVNYETGDPCIIYPTAAFWNDVYTALTQSLNRDGSLKSAAVQAALGITSLPPADWTVLPVAPTTISYLGQRSYTMLFPGVDYTDRLQPATRLRVSRTVPAPTQCTLLNGTNQYWSKSSPAKMTWTDDWAIDVSIPAITSYAAGVIVSRFNGTSGWALEMTADGRIYLTGYNGGSGNLRNIFTMQSIPLNKDVRITAQLDMSAFTASPTTSYIMIDGVDVPVQMSQGGSNPSTLVQAGNLEVGAQNGGQKPWPGKIAQLAIFNAKVAQSTIRSYHSQGYTGSEPAIASAYSFSNSTADLNTTTPNNLVSNGGAVATHSASPFGTQANGTVSASIDFGVIVAAVVAGSDTVVTLQVPAGCMIPTSGGVSSVSYSNLKAPYGFPADKERWRIEAIYLTQVLGAYGSINAWHSVNAGIVVPAGVWRIGWGGMHVLQSTASGQRSGWVSLSDTVPPNGSYGQELTASMYAAVGSYLRAYMARDTRVNLASQTKYTILTAIENATGSETFAFASAAPAVLYAENPFI